MTGRRRSFLSIRFAQIMIVGYMEMTTFPENLVCTFKTFSVEDKTESLNRLLNVFP